MAVIAEMAPAKVNLTLRVRGRRTDGYHDLESLVAFADVADRLTLDPRKRDGFSMSGPSAAAVEGPNLVERVIARAHAVAPGVPFGHMHLAKHLPVAAGIGGGSADAAAALRAILRRHPDEPRLAQLAADAVGLGSDVPACLVVRALVMRGIGEIVLPFRHWTPVAAVLANPRVPLATAAVFEALAARPVPPDTRPLAWPETIEDFDTLLDLLADRPNDLEPPALALRPVISDVLEALARLPGCRLVRMSGSGPTCVGLYKDQGAAGIAAARLQQAKPGWWVTAATLT